MAFEFKLPDLGEGVHEGEIKKWLVQVGDTVQSDQPIAELETDKAVVEMSSPKAGTILKVYGPEGTRIKVGEILIVIGAPGEQVPTTVAASKPVSVSPSVGKPATLSPAPMAASAPKPVSVPAAMPAAVSSAPQGHLEPGQVLATPYVRKLAREMGIDLTQIKGTGPGGRISEEDLKRGPGTAASQASGSPHSASSLQPPVSGAGLLPSILQLPPIVIDGEVERVPFKGLRRKVAEHMVASFRTTVPVTHMDEADVTELAKVREREKANATAQGVHLTYLPFIVKALIAALREFPQLNSSLDEAAQEIVLKKYYHIGIAVDTDEGLMVPVVKNAEKKNIIQIGREIAELAEKAKARTLTMDQLKGGSFTVTNIGSAGGMFATPIINYPDVAILGVYRMQDKPVIRDGQVVVRKMLGLTVTFDHRIVDGAYAARFMNTVKKHLEDPGLLLVDE